MFELLKKIFGTSQDRQIHRFKKIVAEVNRLEVLYQGLSDEEVRQKTFEFKKRHSDGESLDKLLPEAYAVIKNVCRRMVGHEAHVSGYDQKWDMIPYDVQIVGGIALHYGFISEMQTGEGKTLTATMPLYLNALSGQPVHLITVNDYLVKRDVEWVGSILRWLGLTTGMLTNDTPQHLRKETYKADVVYGTASEFGFDYLRDNSMAQHRNEQVQRGHFFAIIDEVDSILIDEARTPLIISGPVPNSRQMYDKLQGATSLLVKKQRDLCGKIATEARRVVESYWGEEKISTKEKKELDEIKGACRRLWLVSKGMPTNKVLKRAKEQPDLRAELESIDTYFHGDQNKKEKGDLLAELYLVIDEKGNEFELTDKGIATWSEITENAGQDFVMLDLGHEYALVDGDLTLSEEERVEKKIALVDEDAARKERAHNLRQLLRAHLLMERDVDYIVQENKIVIIDENTGRPQPGRRFSDGLHQAIEAKEGVEIQKETQTYATITLQNYFRMYDKLAGMTGTAITEAAEFKEIYKLDVLQIPTYKACAREDFNDEIYMSEREKYHSILKEVKEIHAKGRPILIGTESVEVSEKLSRILRQNRIEHTVLNAKHHASEAEIIAQAGKEGAVTVSTNMAGRGTDIKLASEVAALGGLHVIGTTRHQSRRIDRQLRGRSARLGDPGSSKFFISFEDPLMRLFASPRLTTMIQRFRPPEGEPISASILNRSIETAQKRVESRNYMMRKVTLEYDDVMNKQRKEIYSFRNYILNSDSVEELAKELLEDLCVEMASKYFVSRSEHWDPEGYREWLMTHFPITIEEGYFDKDALGMEKAGHLAAAQVVGAFEQRLNTMLASMRGKIDLERLKNDAIASLMLHKVDERWQEHLLVMDHLRAEVNLRTIAQKDPLVEFKHEAFKLFFDLTHILNNEIAKSLFKLSFRTDEPTLFEDMLGRINFESDRLIFGDGFTLPEVAESRSVAPSKVTPLVVSLEKQGRNELCPCNSGKKYKKCCGVV